MNPIIATYVLRSKGTDLGKVEFDHHDWPWFSGRFVPFDSFSALADLFNKEEQIHQHETKREERDGLWRQIVLMQLELVDSVSGKVAGEPDILYIRSGRVRWRGHTGALRALYKD